MKTSVQRTCRGVGIVAALAFSGLLSAQQPATQPAAPVPVVVTPTNAQYKVVDISQLPVAKGLNAVGTLESILNQLAADGWKVVTMSGTLIILSR